jgi:N-methylhydantoinase A/oxoprolinase/acetone carboxylase beta subunit
MSAEHTFRIGIDVGGTFTHAVALNASTLKLIGKVKVPTTHKAKDGVASGIIQSLQMLLDKCKIKPEDVSFIAHSTTQATNALLEGDVAPVGILAMGKGQSAWLAYLATKIGKIELAKDKYLNTYHRFLNTNEKPSDETIKALLLDLQKAGAQVIVATEAFSVDDQENENRVVALAKELGIPATSGAQVSKLYGLKIRTRTAVINAAMLPKMIETANMTESSVRASGIKAPIMIMRSDGGVMDIEAMRERPILTRLSGPAAGVAAAMMYLNITDGIFLEVGGTSTDISVIRNGRALVKDAEIGGHRLYLKSLDVKTVGVAGGSMVRAQSHKIIDIGPRSAHIAGLNYVSFSENISNPKFHYLQPKENDPNDYLAIGTGNDPASMCLTPTCAANYLQLVPESDCAYGNKKTIEIVFEALAKEFATKANLLAENILKMAHEKCYKVIKKFIADYKLHPDTITLVGGGGGAAALVPFIAKELQLPHSLAENADVVSAIGVALALLRETVERNIVQPKQEDILQIREEAYKAVQKMGADPKTIEVYVEVDPRVNVVRATATGAASLTKPDEIGRVISADELIKIVANSMRVKDSEVNFSHSTNCFKIYTAYKTKKYFAGLFKSKYLSIRVVDERGVIRLKIEDGLCQIISAKEIDMTITNLVDKYATYGDAGKVLPNVMLLVGPKIIDLSHLAEPAQILALAKAELDLIGPDTQIAVLLGL